MPVSSLAVRLSRALNEAFTFGHFSFTLNSAILNNDVDSRLSVTDMNQILIWQIMSDHYLPFFNDNCVDQLSWALNFASQLHTEVYKWSSVTGSVISTKMRYNIALESQSEFPLERSSIRLGWLLPCSLWHDKRHVTLITHGFYY